MAIFHLSARQLQLEILYWGAKDSGKAATLQSLYESVPPAARTKMIAISRGDEVELMTFELVPPGTGSIRPYETTRIKVTSTAEPRFLMEADGVVLVIDSRRAAMRDNRSFVEAVEAASQRAAATRQVPEILTMMLRDSAAEGVGAIPIQLPRLPIVLQYNKRDVSDALPLEEMNRHFNRRRPAIESIATEGRGVRETLDAVVNLVSRQIEMYRD